MNRICLSVASLLLVASCGTLFSDKEDKITIESDPQGAEVVINGEVKGKTPLEVVLERDTFKRLSTQIKKKGYTTQDLRIDKTFNTTALFNLGFISTTLGATSWGIDALTGGLVRYSPTHYLVTLKKGDALIDRPSQTLYVFVNEAQLKKDIAQGGGAYLDAYFKLANLSVAQELVARNQIFANRDSLLRSEKANELDMALRVMLASSVTIR